MTGERQTPNLNTWISIAGFGFTILLGLIGYAVAFSRVETQIEQQAQIIAQMTLDAAAREQRLAAVEKLATSASEMAAQDARRLADIESRVRGTETAQARGDERSNNILSLLARIDARLERIERNGGYEQP